jgi:hypothetical protein
MEEPREKRRFKRVGIQLPLKFRETMAQPPVYRGAQVRDVSLGGVRFRTENFIPRDTSLIVEFHLPESTQAIRAISTVSWLKSLPSGHRFEVGSEFVEMTASERDLLEARLSLSPRFNQ